MERGESYRTLIEYFLLMQNNENVDKIVYYDQNGKRFEKRVEKDKIDLALRYFDGAPKSVVRSSGGMVKAVPHQLVIYDNNSNYGPSEPEVRIQVKFRDFKKDVMGNIIPGEYVTRTKTVRPSEIRAGLEYRLEGEQRYMLDFGNGPIPVYVFRMARTKDGRTMALFVELDDMERVLLGKRGSRVSIQAYQIPRDMLREPKVEANGSSAEYDRAVSNYQNMRMDNRLAIPEELKVGFGISCPTSLSYPDFRKFMSQRLKKQQMVQTAELEIPTKTDIKETTSESLEITTEAMLPFGEFEVTE